MPGLLYADDLVLCGELEEDPRMMMVLNEEEGLECEVHVNGICLGMSRNLNILGVFWIYQV